MLMIRGDIKDSSLLELDIGSTLELIFIFISYLDCFKINEFLSRLSLIRFKQEPETSLLLLLL